MTFSAQMKRKAPAEMLRCGNLFEKQEHDQRQEDRRPNRRSFATDNQTFESNLMPQFPGLLNSGQYFGNIFSDSGDCRMDDGAEFAGDTTGVAPSKLAMCSSLEVDKYHFSLSSMCTKAKAVAAVAEETENTASRIWGRNSRKRKAELDKTDNCVDNDGLEGEEESEVQTRSNRETSTDNSKEYSKEPHDYIHVRARRGQATDSHSLAERARREKINKKMKLLQELVPGCGKVTGKAGMLDEIINYVQSLQRQVEFLSMKLASSNPRLGVMNLNSFIIKEFPAYTTSFPAAAAAALSETENLACFQFNNQVQQGTFGHAINLPVNATSTQSSSSLSNTQVYLEYSSCSFHQDQVPLPTWKTHDLHNLPIYRHCRFCSPWIDGSILQFQLSRCVCNKAFI